MSPTLTFKDRHREARIIKHRIVAAVVIMVAMFGVILARLVYLQIARHDHYTTLSQDNRVKVIPVPPGRGLIYSRDGVLLAENRPAFSLEVVPERVTDLQATLAQLRRVVDITDLDVERFHKLLRQKRRFENVPLRFALTEEEVARFAIDRHRFRGVEVVAAPSRYYPVGTPLSHVVGYVGRIDEEDLRTIDAANYSATTHIGKSGVEQSYEAILHGEVGYEQVEVNSQGRVLRVLERAAAKSGADLRLTLDLSLQSVATEALAGRRGAVVAIDPNTGAVLALVSSPGYDPNPFVNGISAPLYAQLLDSPDRPLYNRALQALYPPGSTIKPFLALAGLEYGVRKPTAEEWCPGFFQLRGDDHKYRCWKRPGHGHLDVSGAIAESCDVYFYSLAQDLKIDRIHEFLDRFGFGRRTGIDLPRESAGVNPSREWKRAARKEPWYPGETLIAGIGQGFHLVTPLQLAHAAAVIARRGVSATPHIVDRIERADSGEGEAVAAEEEAAVQVRQAKTWEVIVEALHQVVQGPRGTARRSAEGASYQYAGKTGTSQLFGLKQDEERELEDIDERLRDHGLFIAFAPIEAPRIAVAVVIENGGSGSGAAAPVARRVLDHYLLKTLPGRLADDHG